MITAWIKKYVIISIIGFAMIGLVKGWNSFYNFIFTDEQKRIISSKIKERKRQREERKARFRKGVAFVWCCVCIGITIHMLPTYSPVEIIAGLLVLTVFFYVIFFTVYK